MVLWYYDRLQYNVDYIRGLNDPGMVRLSIYVIPPLDLVPGSNPVVLELSSTPGDIS